MGKTRECKGCLGEAPADAVYDGGEMLAQQDIDRLLKNFNSRGNQGWNQDDSDYRQGPEPGRWQIRPAQQQQERQRRRHETATQIVKKLPSGQARERIFLSAVPGSGNARLQPTCKLPIAANPAVPAAHVRAVARRVFLVQQHIAYQSGARVTTFQQIVAEDAVFGKAILERSLERIDLVDSLADEGAFTEQVLVDVGDGAGIGVDAWLLPVQASVARAIRAGQAHAHARLQDAVALTDFLLDFVVARAVERVRQGPNKLPRGVARKLRICVEGNDILHVR